MPRKPPSHARPDERKYRILRHYSEHSERGEAVSLAALKDELDVSMNTLQSDLDDIRKDLPSTIKEDRGLRPLKFLIDPRRIDSFQEKVNLARGARQWLQGVATNFLQTFVDGGTTCRVLYEVLTEHPPGGSLATVYTNDVGTAIEAGRSQKIQTQLLPGKVTRNFTVVGTDAEDYLRQREFDVSLLSCSEIVVYPIRDMGTILLISTAAIDEVTLKQAVMARSRRVALLVDRPKIVVSTEIDLKRPPARAKDLSPESTPLQVANHLSKVHSRFSTFAFAFDRKTRVVPSLQPSKPGENAEASDAPTEFKVFSTPDGDSDVLQKAFEDFPGVLQLCPDRTRTAD